MNYRFAALCCALWLLAGCGTSRKALNNDHVTVNLDTIEVVASRDNPYRASATRYFNLIHTKLEVAFNYEKQQLNGKATLTLQPHFYAQKSLVLDAKQFDIHEVALVKPDTLLPLAYTYDSLQINITLDKEYTAKDELKLFIRYTAKPEERANGGSAAITNDKGLYFINPLGTDSTKPIQVWTQGETEASSCWFPTIDKPNQKTTQDIYITRPKKYVSLSNGVLVSSKDNGDSTVTDYWRMNLPHAPYLFMMAVGEFEVIKANWRDVPVSYYVEPKYAPYAKQIFGNTPQMMEFFSQKLGFDYPWPKYAQVIVRDYVSGAMENTSATLHGEFLHRNPRELLDETYEDIISHELFHQWFGDLVTTESWSNIPLNESFATYGEYLWNEYKYGKLYADYKLMENYEKYLEEAQGKNVDLIRFYYNSNEDMFDRHSYEKGGLLLHYLRNIIGDEAFFKSLELYLKTNQFKPVEVHQLRLAFEAVTGRDMNRFFNQWFLNSGHPVLNVTYSYTADSVYVNIKQQQNTGRGTVYELPMKVAIHYGENTYIQPVELTRKEQTFAFKATGKPDLIDIDADRVVLCEKTENKTVEEYAFQYRKSPLFMARYEALLAIADSQETNPLARQTMELAMNDAFFYLRKTAIDNLEIPKDKPATIMDTLQYRAQYDANSHVRRAAIEKLADYDDDTLYESLYTHAVGDSSYSVAGEALKALSDINSTKALTLADSLAREENNDILAAVAHVYAAEGNENYNGFFQKALQQNTGIRKYYLFYYYANFLTRMEKGMVLGGIAKIESEATAAADNHFLLGAGKGSLKRIAKNFEDKKRKAQKDITKEDGQTAKLELEERIGRYDEIIAAANDALGRLNKTPVTE